MNAISQVFAHWQGIEEPLLMGKLHLSHSKRTEVFHFAYDKGFLESKYRVQLDPNLILGSGHLYNDQSDKNFRVFLDSCPDRWGRLLMQRRASIDKRKGRRANDRLTELDYLLGVHDSYRMGGLRFKKEPNPNWLDDNERLAAPPIASLHELEYAAMQIEDDPNIDSDEFEHWINMLISPGSSLGGARPKACVVDRDDLWIAKFPNKADSDDVGAWEMVCHKLALAANINMNPCQIQRFNSEFHTFLTRRFDRVCGQRLHFSSAMTQLGYYDGDTGASYLEIAEFLMNNGDQVTRDLHELWRRIVFSIAVSNTDDHLRNHGFLLTAKGWRLSPAYDINPNAKGYGLHLNISDSDNSLNYELAFEVIDFFRLSKSQATTIYDEVLTAVSKWRNTARSLGLSSNSQKLKESAFNV